MSGQWNLTDGATVANSQTLATVSPDKLKIQELERQLRRLTMERDILKKAMAYCVEVPK